MLDAVGAAIRVDARGPEVLRILPRINEDVNEEWLGDKTRFSAGRPEAPAARPPAGCGATASCAARPGRKRSPPSRQSCAASAGDRIGAVAGDLCDAESMLALKDLMAALGSANLDCRQDGAQLDASRRDFYMFNTTIAGIEEADALLIVGSNPRQEAPVLNARIRKRWLAGRHADRPDRQPRPT